MTKGFRRFIGVLILTLAATAILSPAVVVGGPAEKPLPTFMLEEIGTRKYLPLEQTYVGKPALFFLMTSNCSTCRIKAGLIGPLSKEYAEKMAFVMISGDEEGPGGQYRPQVKEFKDTAFVLLADPFFRFGKYYGYTYTPVTLVSNAAGKIVLVQEGYKPEDMAVLRTTIESLVK